MRKQAAELSLKGASKLDAKGLAALATGNDDARSLLGRYADNIAVGLANLTQILSPGLFVLHGDAVRGGEVLRALIEEATKERVLPHVRDSVEVVLSELDQRATVLGAAGLVLSETFQLTT
jgi:predicted NBD/HSP70 family sugar kinase